MIPKAKALEAIDCNKCQLTLRMNIFSFFRKPAPIDDSELGQLIFSANEWIGTTKFMNGVTNLAIAGDKGGPNSFARRYFLAIREDLPRLWQRAIEFSAARLQTMGVDQEVLPEHFELSTIAVHREKSFDGGHLSFWFFLSFDDEGTYYVSFRGEDPYYLHRDS
jgi:hypothetical protein